MRHVWVFKMAAVDKEGGLRNINKFVFSTITAIIIKQMLQDERATGNCQSMVVW